MAVEPSWPSTVASTTAGSPCAPPGALTWANTHSGDDDAGLSATAYATGWRHPSIAGGEVVADGGEAVGGAPVEVGHRRILTARRAPPSPAAGEQRVNRATRLGEVEVDAPTL